jgi:cyclophilin family peptidyl-prolyl cis-trans isomerase/HEAT repeat protein
MKPTATLCALLLLAPLGQRPTPAPDATQERRPAGGPPVAVLNAERTWAGADFLLPLVLSRDPEVRARALRAVGRLEDPRLVPRLLTLGDSDLPAVGDAVAQSLKGADPAAAEGIIAMAHEWLQRIGRLPIVDPRDLSRRAPVVGAIGRLVYASPEQVREAEAILRKFAERTSSQPEHAAIYSSTIRAFESLARLNGRTAAFDEDSVKLLSGIVERRSSNDRLDDWPVIRRHALGALINARALDGDTEQRALKDADWQVRRLAMTVLAGGGAGLDDETRVRLIQDGLSDRVPQVRYEAVRAYARRAAATNGCGPLELALDDRDVHVALAAMDALGDACRDSEDLTARVAVEARVPLSMPFWHREAHAFVALAKRAPDRAAIAMEGFVSHPVSWVRLYAARAAATVGDVARLEKLAYDTDDNVREAALPPLRRLKSPGAEAAILAALERKGYQAVRTAAALLKEFPRDPRLFRPLLHALLRITKERSETSRDTRLPILDAIAAHGGPEDATELLPLVKDFDPAIAERAARAITELTGKLALPEYQSIARGWPQAFDDLRQCVVVALASGKSFRMRMNPSAAPLTVDRFLALATIERYYDNLTIHRVVPNFVIQGGSPGANEYVGHEAFMRDEIAALNARGTVGLSTRGRNTADAQFFVNLVDNPRLNHEYTIFASVIDDDMPIVDGILEGEVMRSINMTRCAPAR